MMNWGGGDPLAIACLRARVLAPPPTDQGDGNPPATARVHARVRAPAYSMIALMDISQVWIVTNKH